MNNEQPAKKLQHHQRIYASPLLLVGFAIHLQQSSKRGQNTQRTVKKLPLGYGANTALLCNVNAEKDAGSTVACDAAAVPGPRGLTEAWPVRERPLFVQIHR